MSKKRSQRIMGMTVLQLVIVIGMGCAACGVLGAGVWYVAGSPVPALPVVSTHPATSTVTLTPSPTFTPLPTSTITLTPTPTALPYKALIPQDWSQYKNNNVEIWLPQDFVFVPDQSQYNTDLVKSLRALGANDLADQLENNPPTYELLFTRPADQTVYMTTVSLQKIPLNGADLDTFADKSNAALSPAFMVLERKPFSFYGSEGLRIVVQANFNSNYVGFVTYLRQDGDSVWEVACDANLNDFYDLLPTFDQMAHTFRPLN